MSDKPGVSSVSSVGFRLSRSGRFSGETDPLMEQFNASIGYDKRMWRQDGEGSLPVIPCKQSLPGRFPSRLHTSGGSGLRGSLEKPSGCAATAAQLSECECEC